MKKIINPCMCDTYEGRARGFVKIKFENGILSICGVIGPKRNGNAKGSSGQCIDEIRNGDPVSGWDRKMLNYFCDIWNDWHLNDLRPYCQHQKKLGWDLIAKENVTLYNYRLRYEALNMQKMAEKEAIKALKNGEAFVPTEEQTKYANLAYSIKSYKKLDGEMAELYELKKPMWLGDSGATETKALGCLRPEDHPDGILCKPCPICGYKYGTEWKKEEGPKHIIDWLNKLPEAEVEPVWI